MAISKFTYTLAIVLVNGLTIAQLCWSLSTLDPNKSLGDLMKENPGKPLSELLKTPRDQQPNDKPLKPPVNDRPLNPQVKDPVQGIVNKPVHHPLEDPLQYLIPHNAARAKMGLPPFVWNQSLADFARSYAQERSADCKLQHSHSPGIGENIAMGTRDVSPAKAIELWFGEQPSYDYGSNTCKQMCGHYTQIVWKDTRSLGCARTKCQNGGTFITCNYYPAGNIGGQRPY